MAAEKKKKLGGFFTRLSSRFQAHEPIPRAKDGAIQRREPPRLKLVFFIVDWSKVEIISGVLEEEKVRFHFI
ncbi:MAG: hypothetical protein LBC67_04550, partial [Spirochaetales bacterium]|nr:hypothetical protein [Spirochaetales bacterium]